MQLQIFVSHEKHPPVRATVHLKNIEMLIFSSPLINASFMVSPDLERPSLCCVNPRKLGTPRTGLAGSLLGLANNIPITTGKSLALFCHSRKITLEAKL